MDDPLIGLTIFDSRSKPSSSGPGRPVITSNSSMKQSTRRSESVDSNKLREGKGSRSDQCVVKDTRTGAKCDLTTEKAKTSTSVQKTNSKWNGSKKSSKGKPSRGSSMDHDLDKCFPCLPGLEEPQEREEEEASIPSSSGSEAESTPTSPIPPLNGNHIDSGTSSTAAPADICPSTPGVVDSNVLLNSPVPQPQNFWLMRLFQSKLFDMSIAIGYLFNSKDSDVQAYLGNKLFVSIYSVHRLVET